MQDLVLIPGFELHQIKMKFDWPRVYFTTDFKDKALELAIAMRIQEDINKIESKNKEVDQNIYTQKTI